VTPQLRWLGLAALAAVLALALNTAGLAARSTLIPILLYGGIGGAALAFVVAFFGQAEFGSGSHLQLGSLWGRRTSFWRRC